MQPAILVNELLQLARWLHWSPRQTQLFFTTRRRRSLARRRVEECGLVAWDNGPLPKLEKIYCGIYLREGGNRDTLEQLERQSKFALAQVRAQGRPGQVRGVPGFLQVIKVGDEPQHKAGARRCFLQRVVKITTSVGRMSCTTYGP